MRQPLTSSAHTQDDSRPLFGKRVLVTRTREQASSLSALLGEAGARPIELPTIRIEPPESWDEADRAIAELSSYTWVVFTSANGVRSFLGRLEVHSKDARAFGSAKIVAVGPGTAEALRAYGIRADLVPGEYVAEAIVSSLSEQGVDGARVLVPRAADAREALVSLLAARGARMDDVTVYRTLPVAEDVGLRLGDRLAAGELDAITFTSSSTVRNLLRMLGEEATTLLARTVVACIGPITAQTARELGLHVDVVASEHTIPGLVRALEEYSRSPQTPVEGT
jgi:uroporphyrinogen III methyltransferase/synthase